MIHPVDKENAQADDVAKKPVFGDVPTEVGVNIVKHFMPVDAFCFEAASRACRDLITDNPSLWMQHGVRPPLALDRTMKQLWLARARVCSPDVQAALPKMKKPLNVFSEAAVMSFAQGVAQIKERMLDVVEKATPKTFFAMWAFLRDTSAQAKEVGIDLLPLPPAVESVLVAEGINASMSRAQTYARTGEVDCMDYFLEKVSMYVKVAGKDMPPLSDEMKNLYRCNLSQMMERASAAAAAGNVPAMHTILGYAVRSAERAGVRLPTVTIEFESEEMKIVYASSLHALDEAVRPLPPPPSM